MDTYLETIRAAFFFFPFIAFFLSIPFILWQYHKLGSISFLKSVIFYCFALYLTCAYLLVILPLPKVEEVARMTSPRAQLIPFDFVADFIKHSKFQLFDVSTYLPALTESYSYVPLYNILLTIPFGIFLRYYFQLNFKQTIIATFLLSLFFELTQLSGLYFIYPRGYRLFDIDDLILNTFGGLIGFLVAPIFIKILPSRQSLDAKTRLRGRQVSGFRRTAAFLFDLIIFLTLFTILDFTLSSSFKNDYMPFLIAATIYYFLIPLCLKCGTFGIKFLSLQVVDSENSTNLAQFFLRELIFTVIYLILPMIIFIILENLFTLTVYEEFIFFIFCIAYFIFCGISALRFIFTSKPMFYEKISKTHLVSTIIDENS